MLDLHQKHGPAGDASNRDTSLSPFVDYPVLTNEELRSVAPALEAYAQNRLLGDLWKRPDLPPRDRSIVTLAACRFILISHSIMG